MVAVLPGGPANLAMTRWVLEQEQMTPLSLSELQVLGELLKERLSSTSQLARLVQRSENETRALLTRMVERGWIEARGDGRSRNWHLSASLYRALDAPLEAMFAYTALSRCSRSRWSFSTLTPMANHPSTGIRPVRTHGRPGEGFSDAWSRSES